MKASKKDALELLEHSRKAMAQIERDLGISPGLMGKWKQRYKIDETSRELTASDTAAAQKEIRRLKRELEVLKLIASGKNNQEIASELVISISTAKAHVSNILGKLHLDNCTQAAAYAWETGLMHHYR